MEFLMENLEIFLVALLAVAGVLALVPGIGQNPIFLIVVSVLKSLQKLMKSKKPQEIEAAKKVENASDPDDARANADDVP